MDCQEKKDKYNRNGLSVEDAESKATGNMKGKDVMEFMNDYAKPIKDSLRLRHGILYGKIMESVEEYMNDGIDLVKAIRMPLRISRQELEEYLEAVVETDSEVENDPDSDESVEQSDIKDKTE